MAYERLTTKCEVGIGICGTSVDIVDAYVKVVTRLCELEDKIESGLLVERPCKVGDTVYDVIPGLPPQEWIVDEFVESKEGIIVRLSNGNGGFWKIGIKAFCNAIGNTLSTTKDAAGAKLKELKGGKE